MMLRIKNWSSYQHYHKRRPPWIKLHRALLDKKEWHALSYASRSLAIFLWLIASENKDPSAGTITDDYGTIAFRSRMKDLEVIECIKELIKQDFLEHLIADEPDLLAPCYQHATPEIRDQRSESKIRDQIVGPVDNGDNVDNSSGARGSSKNGSLSRSDRIGSGAGYDVRDEFTEEDWDNLSIELRSAIHSSWDRAKVFEKFNNLVKNDPPKKPVAAFKAWLNKNRSWLGRPP